MLPGCRVMGRATRSRTPLSIFASTCSCAPRVFRRASQGPQGRVVPFGGARQGPDRRSRNAVQQRRTEQRRTHVRRRPSAAGRVRRAPRANADGVARCRQADEDPAAGAPWSARARGVRPDQGGAVWGRGVLQAPASAAPCSYCLLGHVPHAGSTQPRTVTSPRPRCKNLTG